jgi:hypothetical protein
VIKIALSWADFQAKIQSLVNSSGSNRIMYALRSGDVRQVLFRDTLFYVRITTSVDFATFSAWIGGNVSGVLVEVEDIEI